jgi:hypothetical protein
MYQTPVFEIIMITLFIQQFCNIQIQSFNMLFFVIGNNLSMHFEVLADRIKKINFNGLSHMVRNQLVELHEDFAKLYDLTRDFNDFFCFMLDINCYLYIILTGAYSIQLVKSDETFRIFAVAVFLLGLYILTFLMYRVGENVSREVGTLIFYDTFSV